MERIFEKKINRTHAIIKKRLNEKLDLLAYTYQNYGIVYSWNKDGNRVLAKSTIAPFKLLIILSDNSLIGYIDMPFILKSFAGDIKKRVLEEINDIVK